MRAKDYRYQAWDALSGKWGNFIVVVLLYGLIIGTLQFIPYLGSLASLVIAGPLFLGVIIVSLNVIRNQNYKIKDMFNGFNAFGEAFLLQLVNGIFVFLWSLLLIIPGIVKQYAYSMSTYILADNPEMSQSEARKQSEELMVGNKWRLFCLDFSFIGWMLLSILTCGILLFWVEPYMLAARAAFYDSLIEKPANTEPATQDEKPSDDKLFDVNM